MISTEYKEYISKNIILLQLITKFRRILFGESPNNGYRVCVLMAVNNNIACKSWIVKAIKHNTEYDQPCGRQ